MVYHVKTIESQDYFILIYSSRHYIHHVILVDFSFTDMFRKQKKATATKREKRKNVESDFDLYANVEQIF
jgi:hypothetical protein